MRQPVMVFVVVVVVVVDSLLWLHLGRAFIAKHETTTKALTRTNTYNADV